MTKGLENFVIFPNKSLFRKKEKVYESLKPSGINPLRIFIPITPITPMVCQHLQRNSG